MSYSKDVRIRIKPEKREIIESKAESLGLSLSAFMRLAALNYELPGAAVSPNPTAPESPTGGENDNPNSE